VPTASTCRDPIKLPISRRVSSWKAWDSRSDNIHLLPNRTVTQALLEKAMRDPTNNHWCKNTTYPWCVDGRYTPPQCVGNTYCRDVVLQRPDWAGAVTEQLVRNLHLNLTLIWVGKEMFASMGQPHYAKFEIPALWYGFVPSTAVAQLNVKRVTFPKTDPAQFDGTSTPTPPHCNAHC